MTVIDANRMHEIETRYPEYFHRSFRQRFGGLMVVMATLLYGLYAVWFFDLPKLFAEAHWERVGIYLSQWVSYDVQPEYCKTLAGLYSYMQSQLIRAHSEQSENLLLEVSRLLQTLLDGWNGAMDNLNSGEQQESKAELSVRAQAASVQNPYSAEPVDAEPLVRSWSA